MSKNKKRGEGISMKNLLGLLIAALILIVLVDLFFSLVSPNTGNIPEKKSEAYYESTKEAFEQAEKKGYSQLSLLATPDEEARYFLVYFNKSNLLGDFEYATKDSSAYSMSFGGSYSVINSRHYHTDFFLPKKAKNTVCVCYTKTIDEKYIRKTKEKDVQPFAYSEKYDRYYSTLSECNHCLNLEWPLKAEKDSRIIEIGQENNFMIRFGKDEKDLSKFFISKDGI